MGEGNSPQTSDLIENLLYASASGAVHLMGNLVPARASYISASNKRDRPKSATFTRWFSPTKQLRAAKSLQKTTTKNIHNRTIILHMVQVKTYNCTSCQCTSGLLATVMAQPHGNQRTHLSIICP